MTQYFLKGPETWCVTEEGLDAIWPKDDETVPLGHKGLVLPPTCTVEDQTYEEVYGREALLEFIDGPPQIPLGASSILLATALVALAVMRLFARLN